MLLTVFYVAATWMQSWKLGSIKRKIAHFASQQASLVFYKVPNEKDSGEEISTFSISSSFCKNQDNAMVGELLWFSKAIRACTLLPKQVVNVDSWISFVDEETSFPLELNSEKVHLKDPRLFILIEAVCIENLAIPNSHPCNISKLGIPKAWRAEDIFGVIVESDVDHLSEVSSSFMSASLMLDDGFEVSRVQTVDVEGHPCVVINSDRIAVPRSPLKSLELSSPSKANSEWPRRSSLHMSPLQWKSHVDLLRSFSNCAYQAKQGVPISVPEHRSASIASGTKALKLESPTVIEVEEIKEKNEEKEKEVKKEEIEKTETESKLSNISKESRAKSASTVVLSTDTTPQTSHESSTVVSAQSTPSKYNLHARKNTFSSLHSLGSASTISIRSSGSGKSKPPNVLVYSESPATTDNIKSVLNDTLHKHKYTIYSVTGNQLASSTWAVNCSLLVICGNVPEQVEPKLISYLLQGGKLLCLCSTFLHTLLPTFRTAEVRERELVRFSYGRWSRVRLMHHVFCYQASPARTKFSREADEPPNEKDRISPVPQTPSSVQVLDKEGKSHTLHVQVLGAEETWQTPSLLLAYFPSPGGRAVFSQVHLELDPGDCLEEREGEALRHSDVARKEIIKDLLSTHLGLECGSSNAPSSFTVAYFLGRHELKLEFLEKVKHKKQDGILKLGQLGLKFCGKGETPPNATSSVLPVLVHSCPRDFSTLDYFENLGTEALGRLLIYCEVLGSSMDVISGELIHGLAVVPSQQTSGKGRSTNQWLSPPGCAMFSLQVHFSSDSYMGRHPSILQHVATLAIVSSLSEISQQYNQAFDLRLKWPNDIYTGDLVKIGGLISNCTMSKSTVICNIGAGINLDNDSPTTCLNSLIQEYNKTYNQQLPKLTREKLLAKAFTQLESILDKMQEGDVQSIHDLYYLYWLHSGAQVNVLDAAGSVRSVTVSGIDEHGFLKVREQTGNVFTVHPDGNSFDMMEGLIAPKLK